MIDFGFDGLGIGRDRDRVCEDFVRKLDIRLPCSSSRCAGPSTCKRQKTHTLSDSFSGE